MVLTFNRSVPTNLCLKMSFKRKRKTLASYFKQLKTHGVIIRTYECIIEEQPNFKQAFLPLLFSAQCSLPASLSWLQPAVLSASICLPCSPEPTLVSFTRPDLGAHFPCPPPTAEFCSLDFLVFVTSSGRTIFCNEVIAALMLFGVRVEKRGK